MAIYLSQWHCMDNSMIHLLQKLLGLCLIVLSLVLFVFRCQLACAELVRCSCSGNEFWVLFRAIGGGFAVYALTCTLRLVWLLAQSFAIGSTGFLAAVFHVVCAQPSSSCCPIFAIKVIILLKSSFLFLIIWPINISHRIDNSLIHYGLSPLLYLLGFLSLLVFPCESLNLPHWKLGFHYGVVVNVAFPAAWCCGLASLESWIIAESSGAHRWRWPRICVTFSSH